MGMFDYVNLEIKCPKCGAVVDGFQTKDNGCLMDELEYWEVNHFYSSCEKCGLWFDFVRRTPKIPLSDYDVNISKMVEGPKPNYIVYSGRWKENIKLKGEKK